MSRVLSTLVKAIFVLALSSGILLLFMKNREARRAALANSFRFLGERLLALVPQHEARAEVQSKWQHFQEKAVRGEVPKERIEAIVKEIVTADLQKDSIDQAQLGHIVTQLEVGRMPGVRVRSADLEELRRELEKLKDVHWKVRVMMEKARKEQEDRRQKLWVQLGPKVQVHIDPEFVASLTLSGLDSLKEALAEFNQIPFLHFDTTGWVLPPPPRAAEGPPPAAKAR